MKTKELFSWKTTSLFLAVVAAITTIGCNDTDDQDYITIDSEAQDGEWVNFIEDLSFESIILTENQEGLNEALQEAAEGDLIFFEDNNVQKKQNLSNSDGSFFSLAGFDGEQIAISNKTGSSISLNAGKDEKASKGRRSCRITKIARSALSADIAHYQIMVRMGNGPYDVVRIHRVVRESRKYRPIRTKGNVFMIHGSSQDFDDIFLRPGVETPDATNSSPFYLASNDIDVWGIDLGWTLVPIETTDFSFFQNWGITKDAGHVLKSMAIARLVRGLTRQGFGKMNLLGFSYGAGLTYNAAIKETKQHRILRDIKGIIPTDFVLVYEQNDSPFAAGSCSLSQMSEAAHANGEYQNANGVGFVTVGQAALENPEGDSPFAPGLSNYQFALAAAGGPQPNGPDWHFLGGEFDGQIPSGLAYTQEERWFKLLVSLAPYMPTYSAAEGFKRVCPENRENTIAELGEIKVPVLYLGAQGGYGNDAVFSTTLLGSTDVSVEIVTKFPDGPRILDYGHADLFMADDAPELVWRPLKDWLVSH
ncbi:hypothetical protein [Allomuricauda sp. SCSIO 65647]|uniref:hypothetical protein n=1 Tax=Allomuricauda sp. SCSIO 65647 TaxID=2908843 RepID=UPI001F373C50|nr:hypothetical protein [Muricauda sp. SCSIO 65647]UJH67854.1 hypothetical protein L0P89_01215 [Muricauda sp. SCSIO 65647]